MIISIPQTDFDTLFFTETCPDWLQIIERPYHDGHVNLEINELALTQEMVDWLLQHDQFLEGIAFGETTLIQLLDTDQGRHLLWNSSLLRSQILEKHLRAVWRENSLVVDIDNEQQALLDLLVVSTASGRMILRQQPEFDRLLARKRLGVMVPHGDYKGMSFLFYLVQDNALGVLYWNDRMMPENRRVIVGSNGWLLSQVDKNGSHKGESILFWMLKHDQMLDWDKSFPGGALLEPTCLNAVVENGKYQSQSVIFLLQSKMPQLISTRCGRQWVEENSDLWNYITSDDMNKITSDGQTVFFKLLATSAGHAILRNRQDLWPTIAINEQYLDEASWSLLLTTEVGQTILDQHPEWLNDLSITSRETLLPKLLSNENGRSRLKDYPQLLAVLLGTENGAKLAVSYVPSLRAIVKNMNGDTALVVLRAIADCLPDFHPHITLQERVTGAAASELVYFLLANMLAKLPRGALGPKPDVEQEGDVSYKSYLLYAKLAKDKNPEFQAALDKIWEDSAAKEMLEAGNDYSSVWTKTVRRLSVGSSRHNSWTPDALKEIIKEVEETDAQTSVMRMTPTGTTEDA